MDDATIEIEAVVYPTEDREKVLTAIKNVADLQQISEIEIRPGILIVRGKSHGKECLVKLRDLIKKDGIRDAARAILYKSMTASGLQFHLNKQVAFANHVSFCNVERESPLGPVSFRVECQDSTMIVDWLAPGMQLRVKERCE